MNDAQRLRDQALADVRGRPVLPVADALRERQARNVALALRGEVEIDRLLEPRTGTRHLRATGRGSKQGAERETDTYETDAFHSISPDVGCGLVAPETCLKSVPSFLNRRGHGRKR